MTPTAIALPLGAAVLYVFATLFIKRAVEAGATSQHVNIFVNVAMGTLMFPLWFLGGSSPSLWQPLLCGTCSFIGQTLTLAALSRGDVSIATPIMGTKILFIAFFGLILFDIRLGWYAGLAVVLSTIAIVLITVHPGNRVGRNWLPTACLSIASAGFFGLTDTLVQVWCEPGMVARFFAVMFMTNAVLAVVWFFARGRISAPKKSALPWLIGSASLFAVQISMVAFALGFFNDATATNILYATRSLWSVGLAWSIGKWFGARDAEAGAGVMLGRLAGALLLLAAIFLMIH